MNARPPLAFSTGNAASTTAAVCSGVLGCGNAAAGRREAPAPDSRMDCPSFQSPRRPDRAASRSGEKSPADRDVADVKIQARPVSSTSRRNISAIDSGDACNWQPCAPTSAQRIHASCPSASLSTPSFQRDSRSAASPARRAMVARSSLRSANWPSAAARRSSAADSAASAGEKSLRAARAACANFPGTAPSTRRSRRIAGAIADAASERPRTSRASVRATTSASRASSASCTCRHLLAEEQRRRVGELVRLVQDHRVAGRQQLGQSFVAQHHVGEEQMMIDDDDIGIQRVALRALMTKQSPWNATFRSRGSCHASTSPAARSSRARERRRARRGRRVSLARAKAMIFGR